MPEAIPEFFTGDDWVVSTTLMTDDQIEDVSSATSIDAAVVSTDDDDSSLLVGPVSLSASEPGADWANGIVVAVFPSADTGIDRYGSAFIELQVTEGGYKTTWPRIKIRVKKGLVA